MPHLHLPVQHTDDDLALAGALASVLRSSELYVAWSTDGGPAAPVIPAALQEPRQQPQAPTGRQRRRSRLARFLGLQ
jgi:hypothetical protein